MNSNKDNKSTNYVKAFIEVFSGNIDNTIHDMFLKITTKEGSKYIERDNSTYYKYYKGQTFYKIAQKIINHIDEQNYSDWICEKLETVESNERFYSSLKKYGFEIKEKNNIADEAASIFHKIIEEETNYNKNKTTINNKQINIEELNVEDMLDYSLSDYNDRFIQKFNKKLKTATIIGNNEFREVFGNKIAEKYELTNIIKNNEIKLVIRPKKCDGKELPIHIKYHFDLENCTEEEKYNLEHFSEVLDNLDYNNKPIILPRILNVEKSIDSKVIPNNLFEINEGNGKLYIIPTKKLSHNEFIFRVYNKETTEEIHFNLFKIYKKDSIVFTNNNRNKNEMFLLDIIADNITKESMNIHYSFKLKPEYANKLSAIMKYYKICRLLEDKSSNLRIIELSNNLPIISLDNVGKNIYSEQERLSINKFVEYLDKLFYIENYYNIQFNFNLDYMKKNMFLIDIIYSSITKDDSFIIYNNMECTFKLLDKIINKMKTGDTISFESNFDDIDLFDKHLKLNNTIIRTKGIIKEIKKNTIKIQTNCIEVTQA